MTQILLIKKMYFEEGGNISYELAHREAARKEKLLKSAGFYTKKTFEGFRFDEVPLPGTVNSYYLKNCEFIETNTNLVMYGNVGASASPGY